MLGKLHDLVLERHIYQDLECAQGHAELRVTAAASLPSFFIHLAEEVSEAACLGFGGH